MMGNHRVKGTNLVKRDLYQRFIELTNRPSTSSLLKTFTTSKASKWIIPSYIKTFRIDPTLASKSVGDFETLHDFFTRQLQPQVRPVDQSPKTIVSPVDAKVESFGEITEHGTFSVKGQDYSVGRLLARPEIAASYIGGQYMVLYLSPADYHRIHAPVSGQVKEQYKSGGFSYPVNQLGLKYGKNPISDNFRIVSIVDTGEHDFAVIKVGAMFVNSIELLPTQDEWTKGQEVGYFAFGSTVVVLSPKDALEWRPSVQAGNKVQVGEPLADML